MVRYAGRAIQTETPKSARHDPEGLGLSRRDARSKAATVAKTVGGFVVSGAFYPIVCRTETGESGFAGYVRKQEKYNPRSLAVYFAMGSNVRNFR